MARKIAKPIKNTSKLNVKTGDSVMVISGKDKGKIGNVKKSIPTKNKVVVEGVNIVTKAVKANPMAGVQGGLIKLEAAINSSKVMIYCPKCEKPTRIRREILEDKSKVRVCKKCGEQID